MYLNKRIRVCMLDPVPVIRWGVKGILRQSPAFLVRSHIDPSDTRDVDPEIHDVDLLFVNAGGEWGCCTAMLRSLSRNGYFIPRILYSYWKQPFLLEEALELRAEGMLSLLDTSSEYLRAAKAVLRGERYRSRRVVSIMKRFGYNDRHLSLLTGTELKILRILSLNKTSKEIADEMVISYRTVQKHRENITRKLHLQGTNALLGFALEQIHTPPAGR